MIDLQAVGDFVTDNVVFLGVVGVFLWWILRDLIRK